MEPRRIVIMDGRELTEDEFAEMQAKAEAEGCVVEIAHPPGRPGRAEMLAVSALAIAAVPGYMRSLFGNGSPRQTIQDRTPPGHRRFPVPKRK